MKITKLPLKNACLIEPEPVSDHRGQFSRIFCKSELSKILGHDKEIVQINHSINKKKGALRGMHFQYPPKAEVKIVSCINGAVFDVMIDLRKNSKTFLNWHGEILTKENQKMMFIPEGFAHGFQVLEQKSELLYFHTEFYSPDHEGSIRYNDPAINISWPLDISEISEKDKKHSFLDDKFSGIGS